MSNSELGHEWYGVQNNGRDTYVKMNSHNDIVGLNKKSLALWSWNDKITPMDCPLGVGPNGAKFGGFYNVGSHWGISPNT